MLKENSLKNDELVNEEESITKKDVNNDENVIFKYLIVKILKFFIYFLFLLNSLNMYVSLKFSAINFIIINQNRKLSIGCKIKSLR